MKVGEGVIYEGPQGRLPKTTAAISIIEVLLNRVAESPLEPALFFLSELAEGQFPATIGVPADPVGFEPAQSFHLPLRQNPGRKGILKPESDEVGCALLPPVGQMPSIYAGGFVGIKGNKGRWSRHPL